MADRTRAKRYQRASLLTAITEIFKAAQLEEEKAAIVAQVLIEADMLAHRTHGLALAPMYLEAATSGAMTRTGKPVTVSDRGACVTWRGRRLPGPWLMHKAVDLALDRAATYGMASVAISDSHHVGALAAYLQAATERGYMLFIASSVPSLKGVAPFGGTTPVFTPNPIAAGIPTGGDPILIDVSASITTINSARQLARSGGQFPQDWAIDAHGLPTRDPKVLLEQGGSLLPAGGLDHGHKGYAWALLAEAFSQGLSGYGRADKPAGTSMSVFIQAIDPGAFGGVDDFQRQMNHLAANCRASAPLLGVDKVRLPGEQALRSRRIALCDGVELSNEIIQGLLPWATRFSVQFPDELPS